MIFTEDIKRRSRQNITQDLIIFFKSFQVSFGKRKRRRRKDQELLGNSLFELFVIFQVQIFVFPIFCKHLVDQKYPYYIPLTTF